jgi:hypothetical protein
MNVVAYYESLTRELEALKDRVRDFIQDRHWQTDGEWKESVLRSVIGRRLPDTVKIGRGFVLTETGPSSQCDILLYRASAPVLFRDGDLVFVTPDAVLGVVEVKSRANTATLRSALQKLAEIGRSLGSHREHSFLGLFSYEVEIGNDHAVLDALRDLCDLEVKVVDYVNLGCSTFVRWWSSSPAGLSEYRHWHSYCLPNMSAGYFIANVIDFVSPDSVGSNAWLWFPEGGKESWRTDDAPFRARAMPPANSGIQTDAASRRQSRAR